jgi:hypothetical protein
MSVDTTIEYPDGTEVYSNTVSTPSTENAHIEKLWAQHRINYLLRMVSLEGETQSLKEEIVNLGMNYGIIVEGYTALLITTDEPEESTTEEPSTDSTYQTATPTTAVACTGTTGSTGIASNPPAAAALDTSLIGVVGQMGFCVVVLGLLVIAVRKRQS